MNKSTFSGSVRVNGRTIVRNTTLLLGMVGLLCLAAPKASADEDKDPPTRVARISDIDGTVSLQPGGDGDWGSAAKNRPMTIGDKIWVDKDSRAELQAGQASLHLGSMTALSFLNLDENITQVRLAEGSINFRVRELREGDLYEVDAPNVAFIVKQAGAFRIDVDESGEASRVTVIRGEGEVTAGGKTYDVHTGERAEFSGTDNIEYNVDRAPGPDGLDRWASERDQKEDNSVSARYVSRDMVGYSDLDDHGTWSEEPEYGHVWYPNDVGDDWAPYSSGNWNWVGPWGWTWVDYEPWGFAPFHYGRWSYIGSRWGWCPGPFFGPPIYGPAFVGFLGGGVGFGVGWFPLGFGEPFFPWFPCRRGFVERINVRNTFIRNNNVFNRNIHNVNFVNAHNVRAVTVANHNTFVNGQAINRGATRLNAASLRGAQVTNSVGLKPTQHSSLGAVNLNSRVARPSAAVQNRGVLARTAPAAGASNMRVHTIDRASLTPGRLGNAPGNGAINRPMNGAMNQRGVSPSHNGPIMSGRPGSLSSSPVTSPRQRGLSQDRPPSAMGNSQRMPNSAISNSSPQRSSNSPRAWEAQGNATDRGRAPAGFGRSTGAANSPGQSERSMPRGDRPPWAGHSDSGANMSGSRVAAPNNSSRPNSSNGARVYEPPQRANRDAPSNNNNGRGYSQPRSYSPPPSRSNSAPPSRSYSAPPSRSYSAPPSRSYSAPPSRSYSPSRTYSAPSRSYPAPSRSYSAPSRSSGGGGGGGGGSRSGGGGGGSRGGGGGGSPHGGGSVSHGRH